MSILRDDYCSVKSFQWLLNLFTIIDNDSYHDFILIVKVAIEERYIAIISATRDISLFFDHLVVDKTRLRSSY